MDQYHPSSLCGVFHALGDPNRMAMLQRMSQGEVAVSDLAGRLDITLTATLKHLGVLERAGLASTTKVGRERRCSLKVDSLRDIESWVQSTREAWMFRLDRLEAFLRVQEESR
jgi:DNA-binding transcriptional ArsR family regulator